MEHQDYLGHRLIEVALLPARVVYLIAEDSTSGFRAAVRTATQRWGGMTEPIIEASTDAGTVATAELIRVADVQALVNVNADPGRAQELADSWNLPLVALDAMGSTGIWQFTSRPEAACHNLIGPAADTCFRADPEGPLWAVAVAGIYDAPDEAAYQGPVIPAQDTLLGAAQSTGATALQQGMAGFQEHQRSSQSVHDELPIVVVIARPDSLPDVLWFWNARALRLHVHTEMPLLLFPDDAPKNWINFARDIRLAQVHSGLRVQPDVVFISQSVAEDDLHEAAHQAGLVASFDDELRHSRLAEAPEPLTYAINVDVSSGWLFDRRWGAMKRSGFNQFAGPSRFDVKLPVILQHPAAGLLRLAGEPFNGLPKHPVVARMITEQGRGQIRLPASWHGDQLQMPVSLPWLDWPRLTLTIPKPAEVVPRLLNEVTKQFELSTPGKIGVTIAQQSDIGALLDLLVAESLTALKTERTEHFIKALDHRIPGRILLEDARELAREFGGRMDRKFRSATNALNNWRPQQVTPALERACEQGWAERGLGLDCEQCKLHSFIPLQASTGQAVCPACSAPDRYGRDNGKSVEIMYRLNGFIDRAVDNGVLTHLLLVAALKERAPDSHFLPGVDVVFDDGDTKEVDIFGVYEGKVLAGEAKVSAAEFAKKGQIRRDVELSHRLKADVHVMAAIDIIPEPLLQEAREHCRMAGLELLVLHEPDLRPRLAEARTERDRQAEAQARAQQSRRRKP
ncbi:hypothetical protein ACXNSR_33940 [Streptomyces sp. NC-S4]